MKARKTEPLLPGIMSKNMSPDSPVEGSSESAPALKSALLDYSRRCRKQILQQAGLFIVLWVACMAMVFWLLADHLPTEDGRLWLPIIAAAVGFAAVATWGIWRWRTSEVVHATSDLDAVLGLEQRLTTAFEYSDAATTPALYSLLLKDTTLRIGKLQPRPSRSLKYLTGATALLLLILIWPEAIALVQSYSASGRQGQLDQASSLSVLPEGKETLGNLSQEKLRSGRGTSAKSKPWSFPNKLPALPLPPLPFPGLFGRSGSKDKVASEKNTPNKAQDSQSEQTSGNTQQPPTRSSKTTGEQASSSPNGNPQASGQQTAPTTSSDGSANPSSGEQAQAANSAQQQSGSQPNAQPNGNRDAKQNGRQGQDASASGGQKSAENAPASGTTPGQGTQPGSSAGTEMTKEEIRKLIQDLSGEVKDLKDQLKTPSGVPMGDVTDPNLYGAPETIDSSGRPNVPIQLKTDGPEIESKRQGSGVGKASGEISSEAPKAAATDAQLSDDPAEEAPVSRQSVPPEYRSVFDNLHQR